MKKIIAMALALAAAASCLALEPTELLAKVDERRSIPDLSFQLQVTSFEGDKRVDSNTLWGFAKSSSDTNRVLIAFMEPASVKGRKMLMDGNTVYLLFPRTKNPIRLSPLQVLLGQSSNGDVARTGFSRDYDVAALAEEGRNGVPCYAFSLVAKTGKQDSTYKKVSLWVEKSTLRPTYAEFFASGDRLLKKAFYKDYGEAEGRDLPFVLDIFDAEDERKHTIMTYKKIGTRAMPETAFRRDYLEAWVPEQLK